MLKGGPVRWPYVLNIASRQNREYQSRWWDGLFIMCLHCYLPCWLSLKRDDKWSITMCVIRQLRQRECGRAAFNYGQTKLFYVWTRAAEVVHLVSVDWWISRPIGERLSLISINPTGGEKKQKKPTLVGAGFLAFKRTTLLILARGNSCEPVS